MLQNFIWNKNIYKAENKHSCTLAHPLRRQQPTSFQHTPTGSYSLARPKCVRGFSTRSWLSNVIVS